MHCSAVVQWILYGEGIKGVPIAIGTKMVGFGQPARVYIYTKIIIIYTVVIVFIQLYVIGTSSFHDICAAYIFIITYIKMLHGLTDINSLVFESI